MKDVQDDEKQAGDPAAGEDVIALLVRQHGQIHSLFDEVRRSDGEDRKDAFNRLVQLLAVHETAEEEVVHPHARSAFEGGDDVVQERLAEESAAKEMLASLEGMDTGDPRFMPVLLSLRDALLVHARAEERYEFPQLRRNTSQARLMTMAKALRAAEKKARTRADPA
ncbi:MULTISPECIES: hemerythrin domain-containing protein [unclassified Streptomyces]|uniref:hemerythrin domain-containing protein n=1 Tax=unclassified Streptomyces TaxID=2593676 RepID=UPI0037FB85EC